MCNNALLLVFQFTTNYQLNANKESQESVWASGLSCTDVGQRRPMNVHSSKYIIRHSLSAFRSCSVSPLFCADEGTKCANQKSSIHYTPLPSSLLRPLLLLLLRGGWMLVSIHGWMYHQFIHIRTEDKT